MKTIKTPKYFHRKKILKWLLIGFVPWLPYMLSSPLIDYFQCSYAGLGAEYHCLKPVYPWITDFFGFSTGISAIAAFSLTPLSFVAIIATILHSLRCETVIDNEIVNKE